jgi:transposase-like protein
VKLGSGPPETLRKWRTSREYGEIKRLRREVAELRRANEILTAAVLSECSAKAAPSTHDVVRS